MVEIAVGRDIFTLEIDTSGVWSIKNRHEGAADVGVNNQGPINCAADLLPQRAGMELVAGNTIYGIPLDASGNYAPGTDAPLVTLGDATNLNTGQPLRGGFCAIADVRSIAAGELRR